MTMMVRLAGLALLLFASAADARGGSIIAAGGHWAAILRGDRCDAESRITVQTAAGIRTSVAGFSFTAGTARWGGFHARLSRLPRGGATVMAVIGRSKFLLSADAGYAWARDWRQSAAMIAAVRSAIGMRIESRDRGGRRFADHYALDYAPTAIDAAAAHCSLLAKGGQRQ